MGWLGASGQDERVLQGVQRTVLGLPNAAPGASVTWRVSVVLVPRHSAPGRVSSASQVTSLCCPWAFLSSPQLFLLVCLLPVFLPPDRRLPGGWGSASVLEPGTGVCAGWRGGRRGPRLQCGSLRLAAGPDQRARGWASASTWGGLC